jgi:hypothetical protein
MWINNLMRLGPSLQLTKDQRNEFDEHVATAPRWPFDK